MESTPILGLSNSRHCNFMLLSGATRSKQQQFKYKVFAKITTWFCDQNNLQIKGKFKDWAIIFEQIYCSVKFLKHYSANDVTVNYKPLRHVEHNKMYAFFNKINLY